MTDLSAHEIQQKVVGDSRTARDYTLVTEYGEITFDLYRAPRTLRQSVLRSLPDALLEQMQDESSEDGETEVDLDDFNNLDDLGEARPDNFDPDAIMPPEAVEKFTELIVESLDHGELADMEIRELVESMGDKEFYATGYLILAYSAEVSGVKRFRTQ